jgi:hypothetical protein
MDSQKVLKSFWTLVVLKPPRFAAFFAAQDDVVVGDPLDEELLDRVHG